MFEYFPDNYVWSMGVMLAMEQGGKISEVDDACKPLKDVATRTDAAAQRAWTGAWNTLAERVERLAAEDEAAGRRLSAGSKFHRAGIYRFVAERMMHHSDPERLEVYRAMQSDFRRGVALCDEDVQYVRVPFEGTTLPAHLIGCKAGERRPCMVVFDGFDVMKEFTFWTRLPTELSRRGVAVLVVDHPGVGEALRLQGLTGFHDTERPATACFDYLSGRDEIDASRIGLMAPSAGGYFTARALAFEPRFACGVLWTGVWDWGSVVERRLAGGLAHSVSFMAEHAMWVFGAKNLDELKPMLARMNLDHGVAERIRCPLLITHGGNDRQTPVSEAHKVFDAVSSARKELKIFDAQDGGSEHCQIDNTAIGVDFMADWVGETLGASPGPTRRDTARGDA